MSIATLRAAGIEFDVDVFLETSSGIRVDNVWRRGEPALHARVRSESGFAATIAESDNTDEIVKHVGLFLVGCKELFADLAASGAASVIDISLDVGSENHYTRSVRFDPDVLRQFADLGVELEISGYPVSDEG